MPKWSNGEFFPNLVAVGEPPQGHPVLDVVSGMNQSVAAAYSVILNEGMNKTSTFILLLLV